jgi:hypothetical protein
VLRTSLDPDAHLAMPAGARPQPQQVKTRLTLPRSYRDDRALYTKAADAAISRISRKARVRTTRRSRRAGW